MEGSGQTTGALVRRARADSRQLQIAEVTAKVTDPPDAAAGEVVQCHRADGRQGPAVEDNQARPLEQYALVDQE